MLLPRCPAPPLAKGPQTGTLRASAPLALMRASARPPPTPCACSSRACAGRCLPPSIPCICSSGADAVICQPRPLAFAAPSAAALGWTFAPPHSLHRLLPCLSGAGPYFDFTAAALQLGGGWSSALSSRTSKVFEGVADHFAKHLVGQRIAGAGRKGKQLWVSSRTRTPSRSCMQGVRGNLPDFLARRRLLSSHCASAAWPPAVPRPRKGRLGNADASPIF